MKICLIHNLYEPYARGGAEQVVKATIDFLLAKDYEVVLFTLTPDKEEILENGNLKIFYLKQKNIFSYFDLSKHNFLFKFVWHILNIFNFSIAKKVFKILQQEKPDVVHTHNLMGLSFLLPKVIRKLKIKHIHTVHDVQLVEPSGIIIKSKENNYRYKCPPIKIYRFLMKTLMGSPEIVISPTKFLLDFYKNKGFFKKSKLEKLVNPLTLENLEDFKKQKHEGFNFLYLGQIEEHKGIVTLLENFQDIKSATLHVVGDGTKLTELKKKYKDLENIKFYGRKSRDELPDIFAKIDITIFPSLCYENYPAVIFESFCFAVPVIAVNHSAIPEFVKEGENGWLFDITNHEELKQKIKWCLENKNQVDQITNFLQGKKIEENNNLMLLLDLYK